MTKMVEALLNFLFSLFGRSEVANTGLFDEVPDMKLTHGEIEQLKAAGFDDSHIAEAQVIKNGAMQNGQDWLLLFQKLIENGPQIFALLKLFACLFSGNPPTIPAK